MRRRHSAWVVAVVGVLAVLLAGPAGASAQPPPQPPPGADPFAAKPAKPLSPDTEPYSVERVRRELRLLPPTTTTEQQHGLKLEYYIQVFGSAPRIDFFKDFDVKNGPVPFSAPTHADMLEQMTPQQYRHPVADVPSLLVWLGQQLSKKKK
jgi:hypothetical protein